MPTLKKRKATIFKVTSLAATLFVAQAVASETDTTVAAYAAGYKAGFTCSAIFNGKKSVEQIERDELTGIYSLVADQVKELKAQVDYDNHLVSVSYDKNLPPRLAAWRPHLGCVDLPVGATNSVVDAMPKVVFDETLVQQQQQVDDGTPWQQWPQLNSSTGNEMLDDVVAQAFTEHYGEGARTSAVLIATPERVLTEHYREGFTAETSQRTWSVAKSITATVMGAAVQQDIIDVTEPAGIENWSHPADPRQAITVEHLLHMASGLDSNQAGNRTDRLYMGGGLVSDTATETALEVTPGKRWKYANNDTLLVSRALRERFANVTDYLEFPFTAVLHKLGMHHTYIETDWQGDLIGSSQVWTTSRDLARLGLLHLQKGQWDGEQIIPGDWLEYISTPAPSQPEGSVGYGAQWWLYPSGEEGLPKDTIAARGNRGQYLFVIPSMELIVVRRGYDLAGEPPFSEAEFVADVVAALKN